MSRTIDLPGGATAVLADNKNEITPRRRREVEILGSRLGRLMEPLMTAARILCEGDVIEDRSTLRTDDGDPKYPGPDVDLTEQQLRLLSRLNDATVFAILRSWSLGPLPATADDLLDLDPAVYDALRLEAAKASDIFARDEFSVDNIEDPASPTGD
ncbi:MAG: hypothetical protein ACTHMS_13250 [Jatrophihabitans sp.]|uniref:hypothetical protein n=1 Tax=Jatrophihabitans sp. TaxID=1932789 RepID=UPI003F7DCAC5